MRMRGLQETQFSARHKGLGRVFTLDFFGRGGGGGGLRTDAVTSRLFLLNTRFAWPTIATITRERAARTDARTGSASVQDMAGGREHRRTNGRTHIPRGSVCRFPPASPGRQSPPSLLLWTSVGASEVTKFTAKA